MLVVHSTLAWGTEELKAGKAGQRGTAPWMEVYITDPRRSERPGAVFCCP